MVGKADNNRVSIERRQELITSLPCFAMLTHDESKELASLMTEVSFQEGDVIVEENSFIESVFILVKGEVEISYETIPEKKLSKKLTKKIKIPLAILRPGESIGLNHTGFFSATGKRTATATALLPSLLLCLALKAFHEFLEKRPQLLTSMQATAEKMLRVLLIKQSLPFSQLSNERLNYLAEKVETAVFKAGDIIFYEGEKGDCCYLIFSGQIEISVKNADSSEHTLAVLQPPTLFGEATLIMDSPRNATARAKTDAKLLLLKYEYLSELIETESNVASMFMNLMVDRSRPIQNPHVTQHQRMTADQQTIIILKNPDNGNYFKLSEEGWYLWQQMDGKQTMQEITLALAEKYQIFAPNVVAALISKLAKSGFVSHVGVTKSTQLKKSKWMNIALYLRSILESRVAIGDADKFITQLFNHLGFLFFSRVGKILMAIFMIMGLYAFIVAAPKVLTIFQSIQHEWTVLLLILVVPGTFLSVTLHEFAHALTTKYFGYEVHYMGVGWYWLGPIAFTDTSDMWLSTKWPRVFVNLAGIYMDMIVAGLAAIAIFIFPSIYVQAFLWLFALMTYVGAIKMLNPLQELDGYYVLVDLFDRSRLRQSAVVWLVKELPKNWRRPHLLAERRAEIYYLLACFIFVILISLITYWLQTFIFKVLGFEPGNLFVSISLPILVAVLSCLGIIADIRNQAEE